MDEYKVFHRTWWRHNSRWPQGREPQIGQSFHIAYVDSEEEAIARCRDWNAHHAPGPLSDKAEWDDRF